MEPFNISAEMTSLLDNLGEELPAFVGLQQETLENGPANDEQIELYIYSCFLAFKNMKSMEHLEQAIRQAERWTTGIGTDHSDRLRRLQILDFLSAWMIQLEFVSELGTKEFGQAMRSQRVDRRQKVAIELFKKYEKTGILGTLNEGVDVMLQSIDLVGEHITPGMLSNFGVMLGTRFDRTGFMDDLNRAVEAADMAVTATPQDHPDRAACLNNLGNRLGTRFHRTDSTDDLNRVVEVADMVVAATFQGHPDQAAACILASQRDWEASSLLLEQAVALLPVVSPRSLDHTDKQSMLAEFSGLASMAAAISLEAGRDAYHTLRLLELGRGVIASLLMDMREDISSLRERHPNLASEFISLRDALDSPVQRNPSIPTDNTSSSWVLQTKMRHEYDRKFSELIATIRAQPGFDNFLLPPTEIKLKDAAYSGPVVTINISPYHCDAFIVEHHRIQALKLPGLKLEDVQKHAQNLRSSSLVAIVSTLEWLWNVVCSPILDALDFKNFVSDNNWPHIWWISTGLLSQFPLHAASYHEQKSTNTVLDRVISSYALSVKALMHGRQYHIHSSARSRVDQTLLVAIKETPDLPSNQILPFVERKVKLLKELYSSLQLEYVMPKLRKHNVLENLQEYKVFHFTGHGSSHPTKPSQSYLLLEDWKTNPLTVGNIRNC
ncbi:hypothetical protein TWF506_003080 [Arthrobotrys conoides]|uniref:CHAT domain-containing protein n=1 Tax=Arthrobotrys conoides TaxID=74498 RepID=A0AAN8RJC4_9PEZI